MICDPIFLKMRRYSSERAVKLVENARLSYLEEQNKISASHYSRLKCRLNPLNSSSSPCSSVTSWWDDVFEASDITRLQTAASKHTSSNVNRKLFNSPDKSSENVSAKLFNILSAPSPKENTFNLVEAPAVLVPWTGSENPIDAPATGCTGTTALQDSSLNSKDVCQPFPLGVTNDCVSVKVLNGISTVALGTHKSFDNFTEAALTTVLIIASEDKKLYPSHLKIMKAKAALNSGREHLTSKGKLRQARCLKPPWKDKCRICCIPKLTQEERTYVHRDFWNLKDHSKQWEFIRNSVIVSAPKTKFAQAGAKGGKSVSRNYFLLRNGDSRKVCKTMFKNSLSICDSWIDSAFSDNSVSSDITEDMRGKHRSRAVKKI